MDNKTVKSKETDITNVLVGILIVLVLALVATSMRGLTSTQTSTAAKAAPKKSNNYDWTAWCKEKLKNINPAIYNMASPVVTFKTGINAKCDNESMNSRFYSGPALTSNQVDTISCCAPLSQMYTENNEYCTTMTKGIDAKCKQSECASNTGSNDTGNIFTIKVSDKCDMVSTSGTTSKGNSCCIRPLPTATPTPKP